MWHIYGGVPGPFRIDTAAVVSESRPSFFLMVAAILPCDSLYSPYIASATPGNCNILSNRRTAGQRSHIYIYKNNNIIPGKLINC